MQHTQRFERELRPRYIEAVTALHESAGSLFDESGEKQLSYLDNVDMHATVGRWLLAETNSLILLTEELHKNVSQHASIVASVSDSDSDTNDLDKVWTEEARSLGADARQMRVLADEANDIIERIEESRPGGQQTALILTYRLLTQKMFDLAEFMEDVAETQALAAYGPFRDLIGKELEAIASENG